MRGFGIALMVLFTGCDGKFAGLWWVEQSFTSFSDVDCAAEIGENFTDASPPDDATGTTTTWIYDFTQDLSADGYFIEILEGKGATAFVVVEDFVYPATITDGVIHAEWLNYDDTNDVQTHSSGYEYSAITSAEVLTVIDFAPGEAGALTGTVSVTTVNESVWKETDNWDSVASGLPSGQIPAYLYLDGTGVANEPDASQCTSEPCELSVNETCSFLADVTAESVEGSDAAYDAIENAGQNPGVL